MYVSVEMFFVTVKAWIGVVPGTWLSFCNHELNFLGPLVKHCVRVGCFMSSEVKESCMRMCITFAYTSPTHKRKEKNCTDNHVTTI